MTIYIVRDEDSLAIQGLFISKDRAKAFKDSLGSFYEMYPMNTNDDLPPPEIIYIQNDTGAEEIPDATN